MGKSGSGKTSLLKCLYGLEDLHKGNILLDGEKILGPSHNLVPGHNRIKLVSQDYYVLENHTVEENIKDKLSGYTEAYKEKRCSEMLQALELKKIKARKANVLSAGQKQRVSIARALAEFPRLLLLDEPFTNIDVRLRDKIFTYIRQQLRRHQSSCILVTHQPEEVLRYANRILVMEEGKIVQEGDVESMYHCPENIAAARLFGKCYELKKSDFLNTPSLKFQGGKILIRPEHLSLSKKKDAKHLEATVLDSLFNPAFYEIIAHSRSGKFLSFYHTHPIEPGKTIHLSLIPFGNRYLPM